MRFLLVALALLSTLPPLAAEERRPLMVRVWQSEDGLPGNVVRSLVQSADGYLWIATAEGIARFDGTEFQTIEPDGDLRRVRFAFWRLFATPDGRVWATTFQGGLFRIDGERLERVLPDATQPRPPLIRQLLLEGNGAVYLKRGETISRLDPTGATELAEPAPALRERFDDDARRQSAEGRVIAEGALPRLDVMGPQQWLADAEGRLVVDDGRGHREPVVIPDLPSAYAFNELLEDREGNVWIATAVNGLVRVRTSRVEVLGTAEGLSERTVQSVLQDREGAWWIGTRRGGLDRWTPRGAQHFDLASTGRQRPVSAIYQDRRYRLWVASRGGSVFLRGESGFEPQFARSQTPSKVRAIVEDAAGLLWFGGTQGLASYDGAQVQTYGPQQGLPATEVTVLAVDDAERIIAGTSDGRVFRGGTGGFKLLGDGEVFQHKEISGLLPRAGEELWVTTLGDGLSLWNGKKWRRFNEDDGLPDLRLTCVLDDVRGQLWFGSLGGILRASRRELLARADSPDQPLHWLRFDRSDGLPTRECIGGFQPAGWKGDDGRLWFPTGNGIVRIRPELVEVNRVPPPVYVRSTRVNGHQQEEQRGVIEAGPGRSRLEFRFIGLSYSAPEKVTYRARLAGLEGTWRELGDQQVAAFEAVPPGSYIFEVVAVNGDGVWSAKPARVSLRISPHFWEATWFQVTVTVATLLAAVGIGWGFGRLRLKRRIHHLKLHHAREAERSRIARDLHDDLGASLTEISILSALAAEGEDPATMRPALDQLSGKAKAVVGTLDEIVWAVNPKEDTLRSLVDYLTAFAREFLDTAGIALRTELPPTVPERPLAANVRHGVFLAAREALNNLVKHSHATEARLSIAVDEGELEIVIEDNGRGFSQEWEAKGYGVANLRERMQACGGDGAIASAPGEGVRVRLTLPLLAGPPSPA